ncbi:xanthine dehydrogenase small subunit [Asaia sp. W19]|uniref:xanthine dehydrogenase small subunit n=1 Tax=unclassified Asaia TaxID=2685023 RepID=UPI000F8DB06D|nr:xanthine dehydrogenase small subunit [Asaia sp. W19]RUT25211.1 xanthine dehydrogenase small subunit [Asaia sp. W19]
MRETIRFFLGDRLVTLDDVAPDRTLLDWLRHEGRTGTKEGCNEGDCGACMVIVARRRSSSEISGAGGETGRGRAMPSGVSLRAVNACIQLLPMLDGAAVFTIEDVGSAEALHPVQQAMIALNGAQCGFCTPGFVMSMVAYRNTDTPSDDDSAIDSALAGNLCRCTGYAPIVRAMKQALAAPDSAFEERVQALDDRLAALEDRADVEIETAQGNVFLPASAESLAHRLMAYPQTLIVAGATDVGLWVTKAMRSLPRVAFIGQCADLATIEETEDGLRIGAAVTYEAARAALARILPDFGVLIGRIGSTPIRNSATLCGNIANGSPIGDGPPALIAAGATLHLRRGETRRSLPLEQYFLAYGKQDRREGEFVEAVSVPRQKEGTFYRSYKISKRFDQDISAVLAAFALCRDGSGRIIEARLAFGGMAATPCRAPRAEQALLGQLWNETTLEAARDALAEDFTPLSDMRASAWYRQTVAANLLTRFYEESQGETMRLAEAGSLTHV